MISFKIKGKKEKGKKGNVEYSQKLLSCKNSLETLSELERKKFEVYSNFLEKLVSLNELIKKKNSLKKFIMDDKKKFMSTEEMEDFSITEEIVRLQKEYSEIQEKYNVAFNEYSQLKEKLNLTKSEQKEESDKLKEIIEENIDDLKDVSVEISEIPLNEDDQKKLISLENKSNLEKFKTYLEKIKDFKIKNFELEFHKLEILEPLNESITQEEYVKSKLLELRSSLNKLSEEEFLSNQAVWPEIVQLKDKHFENTKKISKKRASLKEIKQELSDNNKKINFINELIEEIKKESPENFKDIKK